MRDIVSGTCCVTALIEGEDIVISNLGDCRAVLGRGGVAQALTTDHKAEREDERKRIENKTLEHREDMLSFTVELGEFMGYSQCLEALEMPI